MFTTVAAAHVSSSFGVAAERFRRAGQLDRAVAMCREGLAVFPDYLAARVTLGYALMDQGHEREAHRELRWVLERAPDNLAAIRALAELHSRGVEEAETSHADFAALALAPEPVTVDAPLPLAEVRAEGIDEAPAVSLRQDEPLALKPLPMFDAIDSIDPPVEPLVLEPLDPVFEPMAAESVELGSSELSTEPIGNAPELTVSLSGFAGLDALDPAIEAAAEPALFEIEDVIDEAEDLPPYGFEDLAGESGDFLDVTDADLPPVVAQPSSVSAEPIPVPELSAGPIALLDEWLTRIRARRSELLSEYAAG